MKPTTHTRLARGLATSLLCGSLCGCVTFGRQQVDQRLSETAVTQIQRGMTKADVTRILGAPQEIIFSNREHDPLREHAYVFTHKTTQYTAIFLALVNFGNADEKSDRVVVFFDESGQVEHVGASLRARNAEYGFPFGQ